MHTSVVVNKSIKVADFRVLLKILMLAENSLGYLLALFFRWMCFAMVTRIFLRSHFLRCYFIIMIIIIICMYELVWFLCHNIIIIVE